MARTKANISQKLLAEKVHISSKHLSNIETSNTTVSLPIFLDIANELEVSPDTLLCDSMINAKQAYIKKISLLMKDCDDYEARFIEENLTQMLDSFRKLEKMRREKGS